MRISDWSSDVCSSDLLLAREIEIGVVGKDRRNLAEAIARDRARRLEPGNAGKRDFDRISDQLLDFDRRKTRVNRIDLNLLVGDVGDGVDRQLGELPDSETRDDEEEERSEEHTSELQSLMRISYAVFCLKKKKENIYSTNNYNTRMNQNTR